MIMKQHFHSSHVSEEGWKRPKEISNRIEIGEEGVSWVLVFLFGVFSWLGDFLLSLSLSPFSLPACRLLLLLLLGSVLVVVVAAAVASLPSSSSPLCFCRPLGS